MDNHDIQPLPMDDKNLCNHKVYHHPTEKHYSLETKFLLITFVNTLAFYHCQVSNVQRHCPSITHIFCTYNRKYNKTLPPITNALYFHSTLNASSLRVAFY